MRAEDFLEKLMQRFKVNDDLLKDLDGYIRKLPEEKLEEIWDSFLQSYPYSKAPSVANIAKVVGELKVLPKKKEFTYFICQKCGARFSIYARGCPVCREMTEVNVVVSEKMPQNFIYARQDCWMCKHYSQYAQGPSCSEFGKGPIQNKVECLTCVCRKCCREFAILRENPELYQSLFQTGQLEDRYLVQKKDRHEKKEKKAV